MFSPCLLFCQENPHLASVLFVEELFGILPIVSMAYLLFSNVA